MTARCHKARRKAVEDRTDADLLYLIAQDHERLALNSYHSAECLRQIADRLDATPKASAQGVGEVAVDRGSANSFCFDDQILVDGKCVAFASEPWTNRIVAALASTPEGRVSSGLKATL